VHTRDVAFASTSNIAQGLRSPPSSVGVPSNNLGASKRNERCRRAGINAGAALWRVKKAAIALASVSCSRERPHRGDSNINVARVRAQQRNGP
jgi:hypothetical protein